MRILYAATGSIAVPLLEKLSGMGIVSAVLTQPDAPGKRGKSLIPTPIRIKAEELSLPVLMPDRLGSDAREEVGKVSADTLLSFCYGRIFGPKFLSLFNRSMNVHPSLLPKYRGPSPVYAAIRNADRLTGITLQEISLKVDEGDIIARTEIELDGTETIRSLEERIGNIASVFVPNAILNPSAPMRQEGNPSYTSLVGKDDGRIDFGMTRALIHSLIRASYPYPKAYIIVDGEKIFITSVFGSAFDESEDCHDPPGTIVSLDRQRGLKIACLDGYIYATGIQIPMRNETDALSFVNGRRGIIGARAS